ncbi:MAG: acyl--CoA ligase, partial [Chloroflexota bacterium]|nr:acyl--CoA ligase [Chloroflexota bacterium]
MYIGDWLARRELLSPHKVALIDAQRDYQPITYSEWNRQANRTANWLRALAVERGDLVAILSMNCIEYLDVWFACGKLGAIMQTLNWRLTSRELTALLQDATPKVLIYGPDFVPQVQALQAEVSGIQHYVALEPGQVASPRDRVFAERDTCPDSAPPPVELAWDSPWALAYTGGTTGLPKG